MRSIAFPAEAHATFRHDEIYLRDVESDRLLVDVNSLRGKALSATLISLVDPRTEADVGAGALPSRQWFVLPG